MIIGPFHVGNLYWDFRSAVDEHFPHRVDLRHLRYDGVTHREQTAWCRARMLGGNAIHRAPTAPTYNGPLKEVMLDTTEYWCYFSMVVNFKDPDMAFEFKMRFA